MVSERISHDPDAPEAFPTWKRALDLTICCLALPLLAVVTLAAWIAMTGSSRSSIFFRQERVGQLGRRFRLYKIRTMHPGADTSVHQEHLARLIRSNAPMQKMDAGRDPRLIPGGWLFRASGLDELPQIINVLRGDMSVVGPRPCLGYEYDQYLPWQRERVRSRPGLTGLWQVSGKNRTTFEEMIRLDIEYGENLSLGRDLKIIALTVPALIRQIVDTRGARRRATTPSRAIISPSKIRLETSPAAVWPGTVRRAHLIGSTFETQNPSNS